jgi:hypothetical protein
LPTRTLVGPGALDARDAGGEVGRQQPVVGSLDRQFLDGGDPDVDGNRPEAAGLQFRAPGVHGGLGEAGARFPALPGEKLVEPEIVRALRDRDDTLSSTSVFNLRQSAALP